LQVDGDSRAAQIRKLFQHNASDARVSFFWPHVLGGIPTFDWRELRVRFLKKFFHLRKSVATPVIHTVRNQKQSLPRIVPSAYLLKSEIDSVAQCSVLRRRMPLLAASQSREVCREVCRHFGAAAEFDDEKLIVPVSELQKLHRGFARDGDFILHDVRNVKEFPNSLRDVFRSKIFDPVISSKRVQSRLEARLMTTSKDPLTMTRKVRLTKLQRLCR
jgi:hypothetical protein